MRPSGAVIDTSSRAMQCVYLHNGIVIALQRGDRLYTSKSDVCRRQILTSKVDPRIVRGKIFSMAVNPYHRYSNKSERAN